jgi:hypothetical protein
MLTFGPKIVKKIHLMEQTPTENSISTFFQRFRLFGLNDKPKVFLTLQAIGSILISS